MNATFKKSLAQKEHGFTLIELIIVVVIIGILALVAIPKYYTSVAKAQKNTVYATLDVLRQAMLSHYAVYGVYPTPFTFPIVVTIDGDTVVNLNDPSNANWRYDIAQSGTAGCAPNWRAAAWKQPGDTCTYSLCTNGFTYQSCTP
ncbi:MAG: prepilin-type N-terminal cleavage/methylation domain-containing protein [Candidatus Omnitrophica bacterium]|nr:prepilin-type N-terminal cleavage/methylation domain-containing protein [Candidatus Omnitrophota bacterium]MDD5027597.1 prepilin-type N-terminal cleavage/methylation domain-containing protein [Candidatus Omnitrophota bacterium]